MSYTDDTTRETREATSAETRGMRGMIRRMYVQLSSAPFWRTVGHILLDPAETEARDPEMFSGIGFYSRPAPGAKADAIVVFPGGASNPVIIAARDEDARKKHAEIAQDSTAMFNRTTIILIKPDGTVEIRAANGTALKLPTMADFNGIISIMNAAGVGSATNLPGAVATYQAAHPTWPVGTTKLKAQ